MKALSVPARRFCRTIPCALAVLAAAKCSSALAATGGYADWDGTTNYTITGGQGGFTVTVTNEVDFAYYVQTNIPYVVQVLGTITTNIANGINLASDKTIIGLGTNATFMGRLKLTTNKVSSAIVSNVIIRNLFISNTNGGDGISMQWGPRNVWVDHCTFFDCGDGEIDMTEESDYVTVSWCKFLYINQTSHRYVNLIGSDDLYSNDFGKLHITFHHNWWGPLCYERMPRARYGRVHVYDNYYGCSNNNYCVGVGVYCQILLENNYFDNVKNVLKGYGDGTPDHEGLIHTNDGNVFANGTSQPTWPSNSTVFTRPYDYTLDSATGLPDVVTNNAGAGKLDFDSPVASFIATPTNGFEPVAVTFVNTSTGIQPLSLFWDLGDGTTTNTLNYDPFVHTYTAGTYTVTLTASNAAGTSTIVVTNQITAVTPTPFESWQLLYFRCTDCPQAADTADPDGDGLNNQAEFLLGTNPTNSLSALRITSAVRQTTDVVITWTTAGGRTNAVQAAPGDGNGGYTTNFVDITIPPLIISGSGDATTNYVDVGGATNAPSRFYRIRLVP